MERRSPTRSVLDKTRRRHDKRQRSRKLSFEWLENRRVLAAEINLLGNTISIADGDTSPTTADHTDFGSVATADGSVLRTFTIENLGDAELNLSGTPLVVIGGTYADNFTVTALPATPISGGRMTTFQVRFDPSGSGLRTATLTITNDDADENPYDFQIQGTGTVTSAPEINVRSNTVSITDGDSTPTTADHTDFGGTAVSSGTVVRTFTIENRGDSELNLGGTPRVAIGGTDAADFTVTTSPTTPIASGRMTTFQVSFDPSASGLRTATLTIANDDADANPYDFQIQGIGTVTSAPEINVRSNTVSITDGDSTPTTADHTDFGGTAVSSGTVVRTFTIENTGTAALNLGGTPRVAIGGTHATDFTVTALPTTPIASGRMTTFQVSFDPSGSGLRTATLTIANDDADENPYAFQIQGTGTATQFLSVNIAAASVSEGAGAGATTATVSRNTVTTNALTVTLVSNDTSEATVPATVTIPAGQSTSAPFSIAAVNDTIVDGTQTVTITASATGHAAGTDTVDVTDNDTAALTLVIAVASVSEGAGAGATTATVSRNTATTNSLAVTLASSDTSEATVPTTVTIPAGQLTSAPFNIAAVNDTIVDGTQTVTITASATGHAAGTDTVDVTDNDAAALTLVIAAASVSEGAGAGATTATVSRNTATTNALTVTLASNDTSEATVPATVTIPAGQSTSAPFNIAAVNDTIVDGTQAVTITASATGHAAGTDTVDVTDNDAAALTLVIAAASVSEGAGAGATTATVSRNTATTNALTVTLASNDTSEATVPATVTIPAGQSTSAPFNIDAVNDTIVDGTQAVTITASATGHAAGTDTVDVTDNDMAALTLVIAAASVSEGAGAGATTATVSRNTATTNALTVTLASNDTSEATVPATVTIPAGQSTSAPFNIAAVNDTIVDGTQAVTITASATGHAAGTDTVDVTDNDAAALTLVIAAASLSEGAGAGATTATVSRNTATTNSLAVTLASSDTSEATVPTTVTIPAGQLTSAPFNIAAVNDTIVDGTQTVTITASATNHVPGTDTVDVTDDDTTMLLDFGDAPTAAQSGFTKDYPVTLAQDGARHTKSSLFLGSLIDVESDGQPASEAGASGSEGDDNIGEDDEDGVFATASIVASNAMSAGSSISVTASGSGKLDAWIDFNRDADWDDDGEQIVASEDVVAGANLLSFRVPAGATPGVTVARFRLSSAGGLAPTGAASDGEVEDHLVTILNGDVPGGVTVEVDAAAPGTVEVVADGNDVVVRSGAIEQFRGAGIALNRLDLFGTDGDDTFDLANLDAIFAGLIGGNAGSGNDTLRLTGSGQHLDLHAAVQSIESIDISGSGDNTLTLDVDDVRNVSPTTNTLRVLHDDGDIVNYNDGWTVDLPQIVGGQYLHLLTQNSVSVQVVNTTPYRNPLRPLDTNRDGSVSPLDALIVVNRLNSTGPGALQTPISVADLATFFYFDTSGDGAVSPLDVLIVFNFLNNPTGVAEGEFAHSPPTPVVSSTAHIASETTAVGRGKVLLIGGGAEDEDDLSTLDAALADWAAGDSVDLGDMDDLKGEQGLNVLIGGPEDKLKGGDDNDLLIGGVGDKLKQ